MVTHYKINPNYNPKPITEGEVWQGDPLFPNELRDEKEMLLECWREAAKQVALNMDRNIQAIKQWREIAIKERDEVITTRELQDELLRQAADAADKRVREIFKGE